MAGEISHPHEFFLKFSDFDTLSPIFQFDLQSNESAASKFELTAGDSDLDVTSYMEAANEMISVPTQETFESQHNLRKRKSPYLENYEIPPYEMTLTLPSLPKPSCRRKRKLSSYAASSTHEEDDTNDDASSSRTDKKQNHSEIEKRRRDKMNNYISELAAIVPMCGAMPRKLDKLTVLRMAVQHMRSIRGALSAGPLTVRPRPAFLSEKELNALVLQAARDCFLMVVGCNRGRLMYVSESVTKLLHYDQSELLGQSFFDILHPKDVAKVKEQLSSSDLSPRERLIDAKTMLPVKADVVAGASRLCPGARRSFFCRIKCRVPNNNNNNNNNNQSNQIKEEKEYNAKMKKKPSHQKKYCVIQCTGYLKSWAPAEMSDTTTNSDSNPEDSDASNLSCLVAVGRALPDLMPQAPPAPNTRRLEYLSRHATDGKFLFVDHRVTLVLGFLPQELLGTRLYEYIGTSELFLVARVHKAALVTRQPIKTPPYCFRKKDGNYIRIQTHFKPFRNPWTKDVDCLVANNVLVMDEDMQPLLDECTNFDISKQSGQFFDQHESALSEADMDMQNLIDSQIESHKIGSTIAEEALRRSSPAFSPDLPGDLVHGPFNPQSALVENVLGPELYNSDMQNTGSLSSVGEDSPRLDLNDYPSSSPLSASSPFQTAGLDGNGEAAMAVIMSLLEADAGLGGPVNFSGLPWPLP